jgi:small subunit ribosomal protein S16
MIRLQRVGRRNDPAFRIVVTDSKNGPKSMYLEMVGSYNPKAGTSEFDAERIKHWIGNGAQTSATVHNMLITKGIIKGKKINVLPRYVAPEVPEEVAAPETAAAPAESTPEASEETAEATKETVAAE